MKAPERGDTPPPQADNVATKQIQEVLVEKMNGEEEKNVSMFGSVTEGMTHIQITFGNPIIYNFKTYSTVFGTVVYILNSFTYF